MVPGLASEVEGAEVRSAYLPPLGTLSWPGGNHTAGGLRYGTCLSEPFVPTCPYLPTYTTCVGEVGTEVVERWGRFDTTDHDDVPHHRLLPWGRRLGK